MTELVKKYVWNLGVALSQLVHAFFGGDPDESISGATGKAALQNKWWFKHVQEPVINWIMNDPNHCIDSIEDDEGGNAVYNWYDVK